MKWNGIPLVIIGTSGISKETKTIIDEINRLNYEKTYDFLGFVSENAENVGEKIVDGRVVCSDYNFEEYIKNFNQIAVVIPIGTPKVKRKIFYKLKKYKNIVYPNIISPSAKIMDYNNIKLGIGNIICSGCILTTEINIGNFNLININSTVGHNSIIKDFCVINPVSSISGDVVIENEVLCGAGCTIKQGLRIGEKSIIGLGAFVVKNVENNSVMVCNQAHDMTKEV
ncbi:acetyltransferase [uncultured Clostridium sp.]|uniref:PglD-related sugar-binding protein n=1 Tax=uncultured Clostridium sp. TaxID=59620 RepID=UPI0025E57147|nr:acetyltransferase [uncultured Clostridium sp.]